MATNTAIESKRGIELAAPKPGLTPVHWTALSLVAVTAATHLYLYVTMGWLPFLLAGAGFVGALGLFFVAPSYRRPLYVAGVLFTVAQIVGYFLLPMGPLWIGVLDKVVQVALVVVLGYLFVADRARSPAVERATGARS